MEKATDREVFGWMEARVPRFRNLRFLPFVHAFGLEDILIHERGLSP